MCLGGVKAWFKAKKAELDYAAELGRKVGYNMAKDYDEEHLHWKTKKVEPK